MLVGRTPVLYYSLKKGAVETSTYSTEFMAVRHAVEEVVALRYMLIYLGVFPADIPKRAGSPSTLNIDRV